MAFVPSDVAMFGGFSVAQAIAQVIRCRIANARLDIEHMVKSIRTDLVRVRGRRERIQGDLFCKSNREPFSNEIGCGSILTGLSIRDVQ